MGKLVFNETRKYIEEVIDTRLHDDYSSYSRFLGSAPIFVASLGMACLSLVSYFIKQGFIFYDLKIYVDKG